MILDRRRYGKDNYTYLLAEGADAALVDPGDPVIALGMAAAHARGEEPEAPTLDEERAVNPFLRAGEPGVRDAVSRMSGTPPGPSPADVFVALRALRDRG